jgi:hypothetical protein
MTGEVTLNGLVLPVSGSRRNCSTCGWSLTSQTSRGQH